MLKEEQILFGFPGPPAVPSARLPELPSLRGVERLGFDTETDMEPVLWRKLYGISYHTPDGRNGYIPLRHPGSANYDEETVKRWVHDELRGKTLICANAKHEVHVLKTFGVDLESLDVKLRDVFHSAALINENRRRINLDLIAREELGRGKVTLDDTPIHLKQAEAIAPYAVEDAKLTLELDDVYRKRIQAEGLEQVLQLEDDLIYCTCEMERNGSLLDVETLVRWRAEVKAEEDARLMRIFHEARIAVNPNAGDSLTKLFKHLGIQNVHLTGTGKESYTEEVMEMYADHHPLVRVAIEARQLGSLRTKYLDKYLNSVRPDGTIYYALHQLRSDEGGTITGRYSSSKLWRAKNGGINVQQVTKTKKMAKFLQRWPIRKLFIPEPGTEWFSSDASQIEFRLLAHYAERHGMPRLAEAYRSDPNIDFHPVVMQLTGLIREYAKNVSYAKVYGGGISKISRMCGVPEADFYACAEHPADRWPTEGICRCGREFAKQAGGKSIVGTYDREFPEPSELLRIAERQAKTHGFVRTLLGRRGRFQVDADPATERYYRALNKVLQGGAADLMKLKLRSLYKERKTLGIKLRSTVHDEVNVNGAGENFGRFVEFMDRQEFELRVPILWKSKRGENWNACN